MENSPSQTSGAFASCRSSILLDYRTCEDGDCQSDPVSIRPKTQEMSKEHLDQMGRCKHHVCEFSSSGFELQPFDLMSTMKSTRQNAKPEMQKDVKTKEDSWRRWTERRWGSARLSSEWLVQKQRSRCSSCRSAHKTAVTGLTWFQHRISIAGFSPCGGFSRRGWLFIIPQQMVLGTKIVTP